MMGMETDLYAYCKRVDYELSVYLAWVPLVDPTRQTAGGIRSVEDADVDPRLTELAAKFASLVREPHCIFRQPSQINQRRDDGSSSPITSGDDERERRVDSLSELLVEAVQVLGSEDVVEQSWGREILRSLLGVWKMGESSGTGRPPGAEGGALASRPSGAGTEHRRRERESVAKGMAETERKKGIIDGAKSVKALEVAMGPYCWAAKENSRSGKGRKLFVPRTNDEDAKINAQIGRSILGSIQTIGACSRSE